MQITPEIVYHDVDRSEWVENYILERMQRLDKFAQGITRCHVTLTREHASHQKGNRYSVMVEVRVPPQHDLAIKKEKEIRDMRTQLPAVINLAFGAIERQLKRTAERRRYDQKQSNDEQPHGVVEKLFADGDFDRLAVGTEVRFSAEEGEKGPQASTVQLVSKPGARIER